MKVIQSLWFEKDMEAAVRLYTSLVPGSTIILALSALIPGGELSLVGVLASAIAGALIGDGAAYWTGHRGQRRILSAWPLSTYPDVVAKAEAFFVRYGTWAVLFGRFVPPIRAFVRSREGLAAPDLLLELALEDGYSRTLLPSARVPAGTTWRCTGGSGGRGLGATTGWGKGCFPTMPSNGR